MKGRRARGFGGETGLVLADYFLAVSIFSVSLAAFLGMSNVKLTAAGEAERRFRATYAAESALAEVRAGGAAKLEAAAAGDDWRDVRRFPVAGLPREGEAEAGVVQARRTGKGGLVEVRVLVSWPESKTERRRVELASIVGP